MKEKKELVCFAPKHNHKRKDATVVFQPEARRFLEYHECPEDRLFLFDNKATKKKMRQQVIDVLQKFDDLDGVFFFCHGFKTGIQAGFRNAQAPELAKAINGATLFGQFETTDGTRPIVGLYACDTGRDLDRDRRDDLEEFGGDGGFADQLRDALCQAGSIWNRVIAHTTAGHASRNPNVRWFFGNESSVGGIGGYYPVPFKSKLWSKWRRALKTEFRFVFPFMTPGAITDYLQVAEL